jgi:hypothetical protein
LYSLAHLREVAMGPPIVEFLQPIDDTLAPFGGTFIVHGGSIEALELPADARRHKIQDDRQPPQPVHRLSACGGAGHDGDETEEELDEGDPSGRRATRWGSMEPPM